ncbi:MAG: PP2C family serine/threonine-protein phosphatase [Dehalococcoidia bacterium]
MEIELPTRAGEPRLSLAARSDTGRSRTNNQDYAYAGELPGAPNWTLLAVADGLGGHARGEWASRRAIELLASALGEALESETPAAALEQTIQLANAGIHAEARTLGAAGAATTLVVALVRGREAWWANVGDSRLYRHHSGAVSQVSDDHSWVAEQVRASRLPRSAMKEHPEKNVVTRTVGFEATVSPDVGGPLLLREGESLVLCSDGLHGPVSDEVLGRSIAELGCEHAAERLVELANDAGGPDNITVVIAHIDEPSTPAASTELIEAPAPAARRSRKRFAFWAGASAAVALAAGAGIFAAVMFL